jgi:hypothetical protein
MEGLPPQSVGKVSEIGESGTRAWKFGKTWGQDHRRVRFW